MAVTVQDANVTVSLAEGPKVNGAAISTPDVAASNGVIHVTDQLLIPPAQ